MARMELNKGPAKQRVLRSRAEHVYIYRQTATALYARALLRTIFPIDGAVLQQGYSAHTMYALYVVLSICTCQLLSARSRHLIKSRPDTYICTLQ